MEKVVILFQCRKDFLGLLRKELDLKIERKKTKVNILRKKILLVTLVTISQKVDNFLKAQKKFAATRNSRKYCRPKMF